jgi:hypothetical protein
VTRTFTYAFSREMSSAVGRGPNWRLSAEVRAEMNAAIPMRVPGTAAGGKTAAATAWGFRGHSTFLIPKRVKGRGSEVGKLPNSLRIRRESGACNRMGAGPHER